MAVLPDGLKSVSAVTQNMVSADLGVGRESACAKNKVNTRRIKLSLDMLFFNAFGVDNIVGCGVNSISKREKKI